MNSNSPAALSQILRTTLHLVEKRQDLDQDAPAISALKESMRRTIAEVEQKKSPPTAGIAERPEKQSWAQAIREKMRS